MRKLLRLVLPLALLAFSSFAGPISVNPNVRFEFTNCASGGSASQAITTGNYLLRVTDEDVYVWRTD